MRLILIGPPGGGKGTQATRLAAAHGLAHISTGDMLRAERATGSPLGREIAELIDAGRFVPDDLVLRLVEDRLAGASGWILDGYPRTLDQALCLDRVLDRLAQPPALVAELRVPDDLIIDRVCGRFACSACGAGYHERTKPTAAPGVCDACGATRFARRPDDTPEKVAGRLADYHGKTAPILSKYRDDGRLVSLDGARPIAAVAAALDAAIAARTAGGQHAR